MVVREARPSDAPRVAQVHEMSIRQLASEAYDADIIEAWASDKDPDAYPIETDDSYFVVAERNDEIVGFGDLKPNASEYFHGDPDGEIAAVYVHPAYAGEGIGTSLFETLESKAIACDLDSLGLWSSVNAVPFYESHGFEAIEEITHEFGGKIDGPAVEMLKKL